MKSNFGILLKFKILKAKEVGRNWWKLEEVKKKFVEVRRSWPKR